MVWDGGQKRGAVSSLCTLYGALPFPHQLSSVAVLWVTVGGVTRHAQRQLDARFHSRLGGAVGRLKQQFVVHELLNRGHVWL